MASIGQTVQTIREQNPNICCRPNPNFTLICIDALGHRGRCHWELSDDDEGRKGSP